MSDTRDQMVARMDSLQEQINTLNKEDYALQSRLEQVEHENRQLKNEVGHLQDDVRRLEK